VLLLAVLICLGVSIACGELVPGKWFDRIFIMQFENQAYYWSSRDPNFEWFASKGKLLTNYYATTHPSQPNYWSQVGGEYFHNSDSNYDLDAKNIVDLFDSKKISWKAYEEDYPGNCDAEMKHYPYMRKHNAFISFNNIRNNKERCARIVNADQLWTDIKDKNIPQYSFYTPNMINDGHDSGIPGAAKFTGPFVSRLLSESSYMNNTLLVVSFDEDDNKHGNQIYTMLFGSKINRGAFNDKKYDHYSLLKTVEDNWDLGTLGRNDEQISI